MNKTKRQGGMMAELEQEQRGRINKVLKYIETNLDQTLSLSNLAKMSTYSPSHFHRMFAELIGETPADYVKRLRLEKAAHDLIYEPQLSVTEVSLQCGFSSLSYFTASFTEQYQHSPKAWREGAYREKFPRPYLHSKKSKQQSKNKQESERVTEYTRFQWVDLSKVRTVELPETAVVFAHRMGDYSQGLEAVCEQVYRWAEARDLLTEDTRMLGIPHNNPYLTHPDKCRYDCCIPVPGGTVASGSMEAAVIPGGKFAVYEFEEPVEFGHRQLLIDCYSELYSFWLPRSGYRYTGNPVEFVQMRRAEGSMDMECRITAISLPIEPKS